MKRPLRDLSLAMFGVLLACGVAWGQATAELAGRVADESGAVLPGVTVTATQTDTGFTRTVVSDEAEAAFNNGVLTITLPKREEAKARKIEVKGADVKPAKVEKAKA